MLYTHLFQNLTKIFLILALSTYTHLSFAVDTTPKPSIDIDGNGEYDALTDGLLLLRGMFGLGGEPLITGAIASDATYTTSTDIELRIGNLGEAGDIDGDGKIDALTDGLLTLRYLFGLEGSPLTNGTVAPAATRGTATQIEAYLKTLTPLRFDSFFDEYLTTASTLGYNKVTYGVGVNDDTIWRNGNYVVKDYGFANITIDGSHGGKDLNDPDSDEYSAGGPWMINASYVIENDINADGHSDFLLWLQTFGDRNTVPGTRVLQFINNREGQFGLDCGVFPGKICPLVFGQDSTMTNMGWYHSEDAPVQDYNLGIAHQYDFNGDGRKDLFNTGNLWLTANGKFLESHNNLPDFMRENLNADGVDVGLFVHDHAVGDLNGDGFVDIFMPNTRAVPGMTANNGDGYSFFMLNDGNGSFKETSFEVGHQVNFATSTAIDDFDGDGYGDIVLGWSDYVNIDGNSVGGIHWGNADSDYTREYTALPTAYYDSNIAFDIAVTDVNSDGLPDLVVANTRGDIYYQGHVLQFITNNGDRTFTQSWFRNEELIPDINNGVSHIKIIDFNADGREDILVTSQDRTYVLISDGKGSYTEENTFATPDIRSIYSYLFPIDVDNENGYDFVGLNILYKSDTQISTDLFISLDSP